MLYLTENENIISSNIVTINNKDKFKSLNKKEEFQRTSFQVCDRVLEGAFLARFFKKDTSLVLDFFKDSNDFSLFNEIINSNLSISAKWYIIQNLDKFSDYYYFLFNILDSVEIEKVGEYDLVKLSELNRLSEELGVYSEASKLLCMEQVASNNSKVLSLSKQVRNISK